MMTHWRAGARPALIHLNVDMVGRKAQEISNLTMLCQIPLLCLELLFIYLTSSIPLLEDLEG